MVHRAANRLIISCVSGEYYIMVWRCGVWARMAVITWTVVSLGQSSRGSGVDSVSNILCMLC